MSLAKSFHSDPDHVPVNVNAHGGCLSALWENGGRIEISYAACEYSALEMASPRPPNLERPANVNSFGVGQGEKDSKYSGMLVPIKGAIDPLRSSHNICCL